LEEEHEAVELRCPKLEVPDRARPRPAGGLFCTLNAKEATTLANHLTPEELSNELGIELDEVIRVCIEEAIPIYQGRIDKTLFQAHLEAAGAAQTSPAG
jgi:hypothetical protein